jgi:hypothetical protein
LVKGLKLAEFTAVASETGLPGTIAESKRVWPEYLAVLFAAGTLYCLTCAPAILWQDSALFAYRVLHSDVEGRLGLALSHPLYMLIAIAVKQVPMGDLAHRVNLISAVCGAVAVANMYLIMMLWARSRFASLIGALTLAVSWTFWQHATIAEVYTLYVAILTTELVILLKYTTTRRVGWLYLLALMNGLSIADHMWGVFPLASYVVFVAVLCFRKEVAYRQVAVMACFWALGALPYEYLIVRDISRTGSIAGPLASAIYANKTWEANVFNVGVSGRMVFENLAFIGLNFPTLNFVFIFTGIVAAWRLRERRDMAMIVLAQMLMFLGFAFRYNVPDRHAFFMPFYPLAALFLGLGANAFRVRFAERKWVAAVVLALAVLPAAVYCFTPTLGRHFYKSLADRRQLPYRDDYKYWLQPWQTGYRGGERFATEALRQVEPGATVYADSTTSLTMLYVQEAHRLRPDVKIICEYDSEQGGPELTRSTIQTFIDKPALYVVSAIPGYCPGFILREYDTQREGVLYRVTKLKGS